MAALNWLQKASDILSLRKCNTVEKAVELDSRKSDRRGWMRCCGLEADGLEDDESPLRRNGPILLLLEGRPALA